MGPPDSNPRKRSDADAAWVEAIELLKDAWNQFAYEHGTLPNVVKTSGGLSTLEWALDEAYDRGWDDSQSQVWNEIVCSVCGKNHDRDESAACDGCEPITFGEWVRAVRG